MTFLLIHKLTRLQSWNPELSLLTIIAITVIGAILYLLPKCQDTPSKDSLSLATLILGCAIGYVLETNLRYLNPELSTWLELTITVILCWSAIALIFKFSQISQSDLAKQLQLQRITIRQQEKLIENIYQDIHEAIFIVEISDQGEFIYQGFNPVAKRLTGIEEVVNKTPEQIFAPEIAAKIKQRYSECWQNQASITYEESLSTNDQDWWLTTLNPLKDEAGNIYRIVATSLNINQQQAALRDDALRPLRDRQRAEVELDRERNFVQALLDNLSDGIVSCDRQGKISLFNQATKEFHGLPQEPILAEQWAEHYDLYLPDGKTKMSKQQIPLFRALKGESVKDVEMMIIPKQGKARTLLANGNPIIDSSGEKIGAIVAMRDITERQQAEAELNAERVFIKTLLDNLSDGIVACDAQGTLVLFNQASSEFFPVPFKSVPPQQWAQYYSLYDAEGKDYLKQEDIPLLRAFAGESFTDAELMTIPKQGKARTLLSNGSPIIDSSGNKLGAVVAIRDLTARKQAEREVAQLNNELEARVKQRTIELERVNNILLATANQLEQRNQELNEFAYVASHDLKAPLRAIANLSEWIEEDLTDRLDEDTRHKMDLLRSRVHRLQKLIDALLTYSRIGRSKSDIEEVSVREMLVEIIDSLNVPEHFQVEIVGQMPTLNTQLVPLQQVFGNLISNAIQHSDCRQGKITISATEQESYYQFAVADNGKGIDPKYHDKIFTIFQTLESRDKRDSTGVGLAIVKKAVENQSGQIEVRSKLGEGTTFCFTWRK